MRKVNRQISGKKISSDVIQVSAEKTDLLLQGQKVLIYKPTTKSIIGSSGRTIGKKELVLGVGEVVKVGDSTIVKLTSSSGFRHKKIVFKSRPIKKLSHTFKSVKINNDVFIKPIEE